MPRPMSATESAPDRSASGKLFVLETVVSPTYPPSRKYEPWARLTIRMTPKTSDRPLPRRNSMAPYEIPLNACVSQNSIAQA